MSKINENRPGYKYTPLGWIPEQWEAVRIVDVAELNPSRTILSDDEVVSFLGMADVSEEGKIVNCCIRKYGDVKNGFTYFKDGDILVAKITPCFENGKGALAKDLKNGIGFGSTEFHVIRSGEKVFPTYLFYQTRLYRFRGHGEQNMTGSAGQKRVPTDFVETYKIPLPPISEQRRIAIILSTWDEAITKTQQLIAQLQQRNKGLMQQLLKPKFNWKEKKLSEIFERVVRKNDIGSTNVVTISAQRGFVRQNDFFKKIVASEILDNYFIVRKGEFCYNKSYSNGYNWGATKRLNDFDEAVVTTLYICFRLIDEKEYSGDFFEFFFDACLLDRSLAKIAHEGGRAHGLLNVTPGDFFNLKIYVPEYEDQLKISQILSTAKLELKVIEQKLSALQQQKKGLMQKLLTGEVRVKM